MCVESGMICMIIVSWFNDKFTVTAEFISIRFGMKSQTSSSELQLQV
jgi:hypothetical protein